MILASSGVLRDLPVPEDTGGQDISSFNGMNHQGRDLENTNESQIEAQDAGLKY